MFVSGRLRRTVIGCFSSVILGLSLIACQGSAPHPPNEPSDDANAHASSVENEPYRIGQGDKVTITVYGEDDLSDTYAVGNTGMLSFPLIGQVTVDGLTLGELETTLQQHLSKGFLKDPSVNAEIAEYRPFYILGEVREPGSYNYVGDMNILNAVALAGGFTYRADKEAIEILRKKTGGSKLLREQDGSEFVKPGDIILVKERFF